ncbi:MAG: Ig-like domain-containing protein [Alistipes sp.]|nr:Ig-like domain-containing protein [Alistipes sp.]
MKRNFAHKITSALSAVIVLLFAAALFTKCASTMTPTGGPKDTIPPVIVLMNPNNFTTEIDTLHPPKIYIEFDEYVQIKDQQKELFTSPQMKKKPSVIRRGRGIVVTIKDTLKPNTTYAINFGSSILDNNEGNPLHAMRYVFSTGKEVDSMYMSGYTADSYKADSVGKSFIFFFPADSVEMTEEWDSTMFKHKPAVIARAEKNGIFIAQNLKPIDYRVYAFEDTNGNMEYEPSVDQIGFLDSMCNPSRMPGFTIWFDSLRHYPSAEAQTYFRMFTDRRFMRQTLSGQERPMRHKAMLYFGAENPEVVKLEFDSIPSERVIYDPQNIAKDTVALWFDMPAEELPDTIKGTITYFKHDSINNLVETSDKLRLAWVYTESKAEREEREKQEKEREKAEKAGMPYEEPKPENPFKVTMDQSGELNKDKHIKFTFDYPLTKFDSANIVLRKMINGDTTKVDYHFIQDTLNRRKYELHAEWEATANYELMIPSGVFENTAREQNDTITCKYTGSDPAKYTILKVKVASTNAQAKYILQLTNAQGKTQKEIRNVVPGDYIFEYVTPGDIMVRVVEDMNGNGKWDTGDMVLMRQPERTEIYKNEKAEQLISTKANWEFDVTIDMDVLFAPITMESLNKMLDDKEDERLKKVAEDMAKRRAEEANKKNNNNNQSMGLGGMGGGLGGALGGMGGGLGGSTGAGGLRTNTMGGNMR